METPQYLYHGSSVKVEILRPQQGHDWISQAGCENAVYATSNRDVALAFALGAVPDETASVSRVMRAQDTNPPKIVYVQGHPDFGGKGYLYMVSSEGFEHLGGETWLCREPVTPVDILEINVDDYLHLFRYATEEEKTEIERKPDYWLGREKQGNRGRLTLE